VSNAAVLPLAQDAGLAEEVADYSSTLWSELFSTTGIRTPALRELLQHVDSALCWLRDLDGIVRRNLQACGIKHIVIAPGRPAAESEVYIVDYLARTIWPADPPLLSPGAPIIPACSGQRSAAPTRIAIHPGSGGAYKCWPVTHFATVIVALWRRGIPVLLLAGPADAEILADLLARLPAPPDPTLLTVLRDAPLRNVAREIQQCRGYLGNDAGITHLAALCGISTIVLFGPTSPAIWRPYGSSVQVLSERELGNLQPETVLYTIEWQGSGDLA
ncbi:MAG TPA: glycosyltransferase family 9 protein, partial [Ktedonobacteraceae bacterium]|nr:glycosyltransferase family 9 protein [Ktedonobacteraceae bacterium]